MSTKTSTSIGLVAPMGSPIFLIFLVLKLTNLIDWSWMWVLSPLWLPITVILAVLGLSVIVSFIASNFVK